jgi:RimJ/RimL family protein N-acetyltransferase
VHHLDHRSAQPVAHADVITLAVTRAALRHSDSRPCPFCSRISGVTLRPLDERDGAVLDRVFTGLSATSRYLRFHAGTPRMTAAVRARLVAVDGTDHIAVGAFAGTEPLGIARLIRIGPARAELAFEVVDEWHGHGIGTRMVRAVVALGAAAGITEVVAEVLAGNRPAQRVLAATFLQISAIRRGPETTFLARVPGRVPAAA